MTTTNSAYRSAASFRSEVRATDENDAAGPRILEVGFARFNEWVHIRSIFEGEFLERIAPGAFATTFRDQGEQIRCLFDHGFDPAIGRKPIGSVRSLEERAEGPYGEVELFDTDYVRGLLPGLMAEPPAFGASYRFRMIREEWNLRPERSDHNPTQLPERTLLELRAIEFGPVTFPADSETQNQISVRSLTDNFVRVDGSADPGTVIPAVVSTDADQTRNDAATAALLRGRRARL